MPKLSALTAKAAPTTADEIIITDKADSNNTKRITINNLPLSAAAVSALATKAPTASPTFTGVISIPDGSAAAPSLTNTGDGNTGLYYPSADQLAIATGGVQRVVVDDSGNLGVGTSSPQDFIHVHGGGQSSGVMLTNGTTGSGASDGARLVMDTGGKLQISNRENNAIIFRTNDTERMRLDSSGRLGVGTSSPSSVISGSSTTLEISDGNVASIRLSQTANKSFEIASTNSNALVFYDADSVAERMRLDASGNLLVGKASTTGSATDGVEFRGVGYAYFTAAGIEPITVNRRSSDGTLLNLKQDNTTEGSISVSGTTVSYNGGHLARWSRLIDGSKPDTIKKGTVMTNLDEMIDWAYDETPEVLWAAGDGLPEGVSVGDVKVEGVEATYWEEGDELPEGVSVGDVKTEAVEEVLWKETDGLPEGVSIGDVKVEYKAAGVEDNEQLNHTAISSVEGDRDVAGVFIAWDDDDEYSDYHLAMVGDVIIRIAEGVEVKRGDLLISAGDGTAKPQDDDIIRSSTVAKVTSTVVSCTYDDGSFCVPCVLK